MSVKRIFVTDFIISLAVFVILFFINYTGGFIVPFGLIIAITVCFFVMVLYILLQIP